MLKNYIRVAFRNLTRFKGYSFINVIGLAVGMAVCLLIFLWIQDELSFDRFNMNFSDIYRVVHVQRFSDQTVHSSKSPPPLGSALKEDYPEVIRDSRYGTFVGEVLLRKDENAFYELGGVYVDPDFFDIFTLPFVQGNSEAVFPDRGCVVLTESMAKKYFGDHNPVGEILKLENVFDLKVTGIIEDVPANSHLQFTFLVPYVLYEAWGADLSRWDGWPDYTYVQLQKGASQAAVDQKIRAYPKTVDPESEDELYLQPLSDIHLHSDLAYDFPAVLGDVNSIYIFAMIALFILMLGCINFINLTTARAAKRSKEVGLRKVVGANRSQLLSQFLGETVLLALISFFIAVVLVEIMLPHFNNLLGKQLHVDLFDYKILLGFSGVLLFAGIFSGGYPAFFISSFRPADILKGGSKFGTRSSKFRKCLVIFQFSLSIGLIISTLVLYNQLYYIQEKNLGFDKENVICFQNRPGIYRRYELFKERLLTHPNVQGVTAAGGSEIPIPVPKDILQWEGMNVEDDKQIYMHRVEFDYFETLGMEVLEGRSFSRDFATDSANAFMVNQAAAKLIGMESLVGKQIQFGERQGHIIGVVKDYHANSLHELIRPLLITINQDVPVYMYVRIGKNDVAGTLAFIEEKWYELVPQFPFEFNFLDVRLNQWYEQEKRLGGLFLYFSVLAIFIACLGLFGLAAFTAEQRTKEIGIRKVLGASIISVVRLMTKEYLSLVIISSLIITPLAYFIMSKWLESFAYRVQISPLIFIFSGAAALLIALLTVSYQAIRAATSDPVKALRYE